MCSGRPRCDSVLNAVAVEAFTATGFGHVHERRSHWNRTAMWPLVDPFNERYQIQLKSASTIVLFHITYSHFYSDFSSNGYEYARKP